MGFFSKLIEIADNYVIGLKLGDAHPSLQESYRYFEAKGYAISNQTPLTMVLRKERLVGASIAQLKVLEDGSVDVWEEGPLAAPSSYIMEPAPGAPTVADFLLRLSEVDPKESNASPPHSGPESAAPEGSTRWALAVLGLEPGATPSDIRTGYRARLVEYHPDKYATSPVEFRQVAQQRTVEITAAYQLLTESDGT